ncbi:complement factor properdin isoform X1 [Labeo rohita]|uniref:Complement factor properdin isoform X1 n=1 Tax=Labeo rohita TaxID=84645 RepID=A0A498N5K1_LABRO|nr:complement factor properdin isoform X1 [Labeo rohita]
MVECFSLFDLSSGECGKLLGQVGKQDCCMNPNYGYKEPDGICRSCGLATWSEWTPWGECSCKVAGQSGGTGSHVQSHVPMELKKGEEHAPNPFHSVGAPVGVQRKKPPLASLKRSVQLTVGGPAGETGVPVQLLVFMKDVVLTENFVEEHAPTLLHPWLHLAMIARAPTQTAALAADYPSALVTYFDFFYRTS